MEVPQLIRERLGEESVEATVSLGDEDLVCVTPTRTFVYRGEGLLSDESVSIFSHDVEWFDVSEGRRKTKFVFEYVDETDSFTVPGDRTGTVLKLLLGGILHVADVTVEGESVSDVFSFSELTLVVTSHRLVKHVGARAWDADFEEFPYADVTGLSFEEGSVATQVVISVDGRPQRIKAPSDQARKVQRTLEQALFAYHDVDSLSELNEKVGPEESEAEEGTDEGSLSLDDGISPLVGGDEENTASTSDALEPPGSSTGSQSPSAGESAGAGSEAGSGTDNSHESRAGASHSPESGSGDGAGAGAGSTAEAGTDSGSRAGDGPTSAAHPGAGETDASGTPDRSGGPVDTVSTSPSGGSGTDQSAVDPEDIEMMKKQLSTLTTAVKKQNQLLRDQQETIDQLIEELRRGR